MYPDKKVKFKFLLEYLNRTTCETTNMCVYNIYLIFLKSGGGLIWSAHIEESYLQKHRSRFM